MKAAVCHAFGKPLVVEDVVLAPPGPGEVKVRLKAGAICHSDIFCMEGAWGGDLPAIYGHEAAGVVEALGEGVAELAPGDHVVVTLIRYCGRCPACAGGAPVLCESSFPLDRRGTITTKEGAPIKQGLRTGAFAEYVVVDASQAVPIPKDVPLDSAALIACAVLTGVGAVFNTASVPAGANVAVIGAGGVGLNAIQAAALAGARAVIAVDVAARKLEAAEAFGATHVVDGAREDVGACVRAATGGRGADYVFVTVGAPGVVEQGLSLMRRGGSLVLVGMPAGGVSATFDPTSLANDGQKVLGCKMGSARPRLDIPMIIDLYEQGRLKLDELITGRYPLERINEAMDAVKRGEALRSVIVFQARPPVS
jgi:S-(hydroxymethyl)glutathione dehydrogenase/alcohol dehydrogenase